MQAARRRGELPAVASARAWAAASASTRWPDADDLVRARARAGPGPIAVDREAAAAASGAARTSTRAAALPREARRPARLLARADQGPPPSSPIARGRALDAAASRSSADRSLGPSKRAMDRRIEGLLAAAVRSRRLARGADAVTGACRRGEAALVVVACDAAAAAELTEVRRAVAEGRAVAWGTKQRLGAIVPGDVRGRLEGRLGVGRVPSEADPSEAAASLPRVPDLDIARR